MEIPWEDFPEEPEIPEVSEPAQDPERTFQVTLEKNGRGDQDFPALTIPRGVSLRDYLDSAEEKEWKRFVPSARGYVFGGWYQEPDCILPYDMDAPVTEDTVLYARWIRQYGAEVLQELTDQAVPYNRPEEGGAGGRNPAESLSVPGGRRGGGLSLLYESGERRSRKSPAGGSTGTYLFCAGSIRRRQPFRQPERILASGRGQAGRTGIP